MQPEIIHLALEQLQEGTGIPGEFPEKGRLQLRREGKPIQFVVVQKDEPQNYQLAEFINLKVQHKHLMVIACQQFHLDVRLLGLYYGSFQSSPGRLKFLPPGTRKLRKDFQLPGLIKNFPKPNS